jgi:hypothetical protein
MEFYKAAEELRTTLTKALMNDNIVPKRWRPIFTFPILEMLKDLFGHIITANNIYPYSPESVAERKRIQLYAISDCERIDDMLYYLLVTLYQGKITADQPMPAEIEKAGELLDWTEDRLKAWRNSTKLIRPTKN